MISISRGLQAAAASAAALTLAGAGVAQAQEQGAPVAVTSAPVIVGDPYFGSTLTATGGTWRTPDPRPNRTEAWWEWWRCPSATSYDACTPRSSGPSYDVVEEDANEYLVLVRHVRWRDRRGTGNPRDDTLVQRWLESAPVGPVGAVPNPTPAPTPEPTVAPTPTPSPQPVPAFDTGMPTPVPTSGAVLQQTARERRVIRPFPVVRMKGRLTSNGASVQVFSVRAPRSANILVRCRGRGCPASRWSNSERKSRLTRMPRFERGLRAGVQITVSVTRRGYVGKRTTFVIRRALPPLRSDRCLSSKGRVTRCPSGTL